MGISLIIHVMNRPKSAKSDPRSHIVEVAVRLFAEQGLDAVSVREITSAARVNVGAISYYFGSKEGLIHEIFEMLLGPVQRRRLALLDRLEEQAPDGPLDLERVLRALIEPAMEDVIGKQGPQTLLPRLMYQAYAVSRPFLDDQLSERNDQVARRFIEALARAVPGIPYEEICWRYQMVMGGLQLLITDYPYPQRLKRLSGGRCETDNADRVMEQLMAFFLQGITAPAPSKRRRRSKPSTAGSLDIAEIP